MILIGSLSEYKDEKSYPIQINGKPLLLIHHQHKFYLIENKCGHFGVALNDATVKNNEIICAQHGISFSLETGQVTNRPYENCNPINTYQLKQDNGMLSLLESG